MKRLIYISAIIIVLIPVIYLFTKNPSPKAPNGLGVIPSSEKLADQYCQDKSGHKISYLEAINIAQASPCTQIANTLITFTQNYVCNETTSTFWVDLNLLPPKNGCNPACVVSLTDKKAEINWRCTGALPSN